MAGRDEVVVVTGASSGIGRLTARAFAARGASVVLVARAEEPLGDAVAECEEAGGRASGLVADVASYDDVQEVARRTVTEHGRIDVWVNNAAVMAYGGVEDVPMEAFRRVVDVNLMGQVHGTVAALRQFKRQGRGVLVNVASLYAKMTSPYVTAYVTSKFGVLGFSEVVRQELTGERHIHVCTVLPGSVDTPIFRHAGNWYGRKPRPVPPVSDPRRVARAIVRCADHPKREVYVGRTQQVFSWGHVLFPGLYGRLVPRVMRWAGFLREEGELGPGAVFEPMPEWDQPQGAWRSVPRRVAGAVGGAAALTGVVALARRGRGR